MCSTGKAATHVSVFLQFATMMWLGSLQSLAAEPLKFHAHVINADSEFCSAAAIDVDNDGHLDIVSGGWWYRAPGWERTKLRDVERIGTRFDDYSNLPLDVDNDGDIDLISVNYR